MQMLPKKFPTTQIFAYGGVTKSGLYFPGPKLLAKKNVPVKINWVNKIYGNHMFPVDISYPFNSSNVFKFQVPLVPHVHGISTNLGSDGQPSAYWTALGQHG